MRPSFEKYGVSRQFWDTIVKEAIYRKYNNKCFKCNSKTNLDIHHTDYNNQTINTLILLCKKCHKKEQKLMKEMLG